MRGILEGIGYELMVNLECLRGAGCPIRALRAVGGLSRIESALQLKADMTGLPVYTLRQPEAGTMGVAILGCVAAGVYGSLREAADQMVRIDRAFLPDESRRGEYARAFKQYRRLYPALRGVFQRGGC